MVYVQAEGCAPVGRAFQNGASSVKPWQNAATIAHSLGVPAPYVGRLILQALHTSTGEAIAVSDAEALATGRQLSENERLLAAPEGATTLAGLKRQLAKRQVGADETVVLFNTGSGLKYL